MVMDLFESLLDEFSKAADLPNLKPDANNSCLIALPQNGPQIQLELDRSGEFLIMGCNLGFLPMGRYREMVLKEALRANGLPYPRVGTFAYVKKTDNLILFLKLPTRELTGSKSPPFRPFLRKIGPLERGNPKRGSPLHL